MIWVATQTQPDVSFDVCRMSKTEKSSKVSKANMSLLELKSKTDSICFSQLGKHVGLNIACYSDATYANFKDGSSQDDFIMFVEAE